MEKKMYLKIKGETIHFFRVVAIILSLIFLFGNIFSSQVISPLYFQVVNGDKKSVALFLKTLYRLPDFHELLNINSEIYGKEIQNNVYAEQIKKKARIKTLEVMVNNNQYSRDVLLNLSQLYENEDEKKSIYYREWAKKIDPLLLRTPSD